MTRLHSFGLAVALSTTLFAAPALAQMSDDTIAANTGGNIAVHAIGHAALTLSWNGQTILVDPAPQQGSDAAATLAMLRGMTAPTIILVTDVHGDHMNADVLAGVAGNARIVAPQAVADGLPEAVKAKTTVLANGASTTINGVQIEAIPMYNISEGRTNFHTKGRGNGYVLTMGGKRIYIAGDTEDIPEMRALQNIDAAFLPMNLPYTMDVQHAADAVRAFRPAAVYPYHYRGMNGLSDLDAFAAQVGNASMVKRLK